MSLEDKAKNVLVRANSFNKVPVTTFSILEIVAVVNLIVAAIQLIKACSKTTEEEYKTLTKLNIPGRRRLKQLVRERPSELRHINADYLEKSLLEEARQTDLNTYNSLLKSYAEYQP